MRASPISYEGYQERQCDESQKRFTKLRSNAFYTYKNPLQNSLSLTITQIFKAFVIHRVLKITSVIYILVT